MKIVILSKGPQLYSTQSLLRAAKKRKHSVEMVDISRCQLIMSGKNVSIFYGDRSLEQVDGVIARIGSSVSQLGSTIIRHLEAMKIPVTASSDGLLKTRDKLSCLQIMSEAGIAIPPTIFAPNLLDLGKAFQRLGFPLVIKLLDGTHGMGVILADKLPTAQAVTEAFLKTREKFILQKYIKESEGKDIRALVVGGEVVAAMKRKALPGEFRANLHRGGTGFKIKLSEEEEKMALRATELCGLSVAGVDMLPSRNGPLLLEVNASPGLEGIESVTRVDVAGEIVEWLERMAGRP